MILPPTKSHKAEQITKNKSLENVTKIELKK